MQAHRELIRLNAGETFRLLRWNRSVANVEALSGGGRSKAFTGQGDHWHYHPALELTLVQSGAGTRLVADDIDLFHPGDLVLIGPNVPHYWHMRGISSGMAIQWDFPEEHSIWNIPEIAPQLRQLTESSRRGLQVVGLVSEQVAELMKRLIQSDGLARLGIFLEILGKLANISPKYSRFLSEQAFSISSTPETQEIIQRAVSYILAHHREEVSLSDLLQLTGMSRATFARQFLLHAGKPFSTFRNQVRLQAVCHALCDTSEPVSNIALDHGFNQLSFFNRLFLREFGMNPSAYRRMHRAKTSSEA